MLQESANKRLDANVVGKSRDARPQTTDTTYDDVDLHAFATGGVESVYDLRIDQCVASTGVARNVRSITAAT